MLPEPLHNIVVAISPMVKSMSRNAKPTAACRIAMAKTCMPAKDGGARTQQIMVVFPLLLMQPPRLTCDPSSSSSLLSLPSPPPLPYRIVAPLALARLSADGADGLIRGLTIVRRLHFFHVPCPPSPPPPVSTHISIPRSRCTREDFVHTDGCRLSCNMQVMWCPWRIVRGRTYSCTTVDICPDHRAYLQTDA